MIARAQELGSQRFIVSGAQIVTIIASVVLTGGGTVALLSGQWATVNLRLTQTEQAAKAAGEAAQEVRERLQTITSEAASDRRILLRLESKMDNLGENQSARHPSGSGPSFPPN